MNYKSMTKAELIRLLIEKTDENVFLNGRVIDLNAQIERMQTPSAPVPKWLAERREALAKAKALAAQTGQTVTATIGD